MEVRTVSTDSERAPVTGQAIYVVLEVGNNRVRLLYPWTLAEFTLNRMEYDQGVGPCLWPTNDSEKSFFIEKIISILKSKAEDFIRRKRGFSVSSVIRAMAELTGKPVSEVELFFKDALAEEKKVSSRQSKLSRRYVLVGSPNLADFEGREKAAMEALLKLKEATYLSLSDLLGSVQVKTKGDPIKARERIAEYFLNKFWEQGLVEVPGEQCQIKQGDTMAEKKANKKKAKAARENWLYRLAASAKIEKIKGGKRVVVNSLSKLEKATLAEVAKEAEKQGLKSKAGSVAATKYYLHHLNLDKIVVIEKPALEEAA